MNVALFVHRDA